MSHKGARWRGIGQMILTDILGPMTDLSSKDQDPASGSGLCQSCGLCCSGVACSIALVSPSKDKDFADRFADSIIVADGTRHNSERNWINLPCPAFDGNCSVYEIRPLDCRTFRCALLEKLLAGDIALGPAQSIIELILEALDKLAAQYNEQYAQALSATDIYPVLKKLHQEAVDNASQVTFWRKYPDYLTVCYLMEKHVDK